MMKKFVEAATKLLKLPMSGRYIQDNKNQLCTVGPAHLALVCNVSAQILKEDSRYDHLTKMNGMDGGGGGHGHGHGHGHSHSHSNGSSNNNNGKSHNITFAFSKENWERVVNLMYGGDGSAIAKDLPPSMKQELEGILMDILNKNALGEIKYTPKYDFNKDVFHKAETCLISPHYPGEKVEDLVQILNRHGPFIRSVPQFLQVINWLFNVESYNASFIVIYVLSESREKFFL
jgi:hypothetical protein